MEYAGFKSYTHLIEPERIISNSVLEQIQTAITKLENGEPIQYILGYEEFSSLKILVNEHVLIPRPETDELVRLIVKNNIYLTAPNILDICSGSGAISWALAYHLQKNNPNIYGCDISLEALNLSKEQKFAKQTVESANYPSFFQCDILSQDALLNIEQKTKCNTFDIIVSNPPYICDKEKSLMCNNVLDYEPHLALFVPDEDPLLFYRVITLLSAKLLKDGGKLYFEINEAYPNDVKDLMEQSGFYDCEIIKDFRDKSRFVFGKLKK